MQPKGLDLFLWISGFAGHIALLGVLISKRRAAQFPLFTALVLFNVLRTALLYAVLLHGSPKVYFYTYWSIGAFDDALQFCILYEIASKVFRPLGYWARDVRAAIVWIGCASLTVSVGLTWLATPPTRGWQQTLVLRGEFFTAALISELFVGMMALSVTVGLPWRTHVARISQGLGVYSMAQILIQGAHNVFGVAGYLALSRTRIVLYQACVVYWMVTLWREAPVPKVLTVEALSRLSFLRTNVAAGLGSLRAGRK